MTEKTIDGVSRELLMRSMAVEDTEDRLKAIQELRAILANPVERIACGDCPTCRAGRESCPEKWCVCSEHQATRVVNSSLKIPDECPHMIVFDDAERESIMFAGAGAREAALKTWDHISRSWNAHLFVRVERNSRDDRYPSAK